MTLKKFEEMKKEKTNLVLVQKAVPGYGVRAFVYSGTPDLHIFLGHFDIWSADGVTKDPKTRVFEFEKESWDIIHTRMFRNALAGMGAFLLFDGEDVVSDEEVL